MSASLSLHHSRDDAVGQASAAMTPPQGARDGIAIPGALLRSYNRLGLSDADLALVLVLWSYWHGETLPAVSVTILAEHLGKTVRQIQQLLAGLRQRGLLS